MKNPTEALPASLRKSNVSETRCEVIGGLWCFAVMKPDAIEPTEEGGGEQNSFRPLTHGKMLRSTFHTCSSRFSTSKSRRMELVASSRPSGYGSRAHHYFNVR